MPLGGHLRDGTPIALLTYLMSVNGFFLFCLLLFAALLCLFGVVMVIDGIIRLARESYKRGRPSPANGKEQEEKPTTGERAA